MSKKFQNKRRLRENGYPERYKKTIRLAEHKERKAERNYVRRKLHEATKLRPHEVVDFDLKPKDYTKLTMWDLI